MTKIPSSTVDICVLVTLISVTFPATLIHGLGTGATIAVSYGTGTVCGIVADEPTQRIECYRDGQIVTIEPNTSFSSIAGGQNFFCGLRSGGYSLLCWNTLTVNSTFTFRRIYYNDTVLLDNLTVGDDQVCATEIGSGEVKCWRGGSTWLNSPSGFDDQFVSISSGFGFSCGIVKNTSRVRCWGSSNSIATQIEGQFGNTTMSTIVAGGYHVCGLNTTGYLVCKGDNTSGQLDIPVVASSSMDVSALSLGLNHTCAIRRTNGSLICWGGGADFATNSTVGVSFESIVSGLNFTCGLATRNLSINCWGPGWSNLGFDLPLPKILPGPCVQSSCSDCGIYGQSEILCSGSGNICKPCLGGWSSSSPPPSIPIPSSPPPTISPRSSSPSKAMRRGLLAFAIVGSVGAFSGICTIVYCLWTGVCCGHKKIHNSVQPTITGGGTNNSNNNGSNSSPPSRSSTIRRQYSRAMTMRRQRSGTSSKHTDRAEEFSLSELASATNNFSLENKIGKGSFGVVYKGKLSDGREVAIKRSESGPETKKFQEKESAFDSELAFLSRLHHKHLVRLVGYCEENEERLLVYEFMKNGALYDHLHNKNNVEKSNSFVNSWKVRIGIALDAARGIEYLHNYAVPPIIHRDIKSSNILLDTNWTARVSDFGLSLMGPSPEADVDYRPMKAAGTLGYIDPEYYGLNVLTAKSDVYGLGVVLLELLTGKRAIFKNDNGGENGGGTPVSVVDFAVPAIMAGELTKVLDMRIGQPEMNESEAVELVAYTAMHCVHLEGKDRPTMSDIVANLERALALCEDSHGSISSGTISIVSD